jgi:glycine hydroxymethyltransferase
MHIIAAKAVAFGEALKPEFKIYQQQVLNNAKALAESLVKCGFDLVSGGTDNHLILLDLRKFGVTGKEMQARGDTVGLTINKNAIPDDPKSPFVTSGVRVGTPAVTSRGLKEDDMAVLAELIYWTAAKYDEKADGVRAAVAKLCEKYPLYG